MTHPKPTTELQASPPATTVWLRSERGPYTGPCLCCPGQPAHVYGYDTVTDDGIPFDRTDWVRDAITRLPEGTRFRITIEPITET
jgi:hypothetical protein